MLTEQIDHIGLQAPAAALDRRLDDLGAAVEALVVALVVDEAAGLGRNRQLVANRRQGQPDHLFGIVRAVRLAVSKNVGQARKVHLRRPLKSPPCLYFCALS